MITPIQNPNRLDSSPSPVMQRKYGDTIAIAPDNLFHKGIGIYPVAKSVQSANYIKGVSGWSLNSNGTTEFN